MVKKIEITDTLVECGPNTIKLTGGMIKYTYLEFKEGQRIHNIYIPRSGQSKFEAMVGINHIKFIMVNAYEIDFITKIKGSHLLFFGADDRKSYEIDYFGSVHPEFARAFSMMILGMKMGIAAYIGMFLVSPLLLLFFFFPGVLVIAGGIFGIYSCNKIIKNFKELKKYANPSPVIFRKRLSCKHHT